MASAGSSWRQEETMQLKTTDFIGEGHFSLSELARFDAMRDEREAEDRFDALFGGVRAARRSR